VLGVQALGPVMTREAAAQISVEGVAYGAAGGLQPTRGVRVADATAAANLERDAWVVLLSVPGIGPVTFDTLLAAFGSARGVLRAASVASGRAELEDGVAAASGGDAALTRGLGGDLARRICDGTGEGTRILERVRALGLSVVTLEEPDYPERLRRVDMPPPLLFVRGSKASMQSAKSVAVVGTRWPTDKGRLVAGWIGSSLGRAGAVVVSGLAVGIDGAAHAAVVAEGGRTVAVLGGGHARLFPRAHERLADAIVASGGAVVSELQPDTAPSRGTFPRRNRLVSGLSDAVVVVEAGRRSGALITAGWALEQGRECFIVPGALDSATSAGCNAFLRTFPGQARAVCGIAELIEDLELDTVSGTEAESDARARSGAARPDRVGGSAIDPSRGSVLATLSAAERMIAQILTEGPATADDLARRTSLAVATILSALTLLELRGLIAAAGGRYVPAGPLRSWPARARGDSGRAGTRA